MDTAMNKKVMTSQTHRECFSLIRTLRLDLSHLIGILESYSDEDAAIVKKKLGSFCAEMANFPPPGDLSA